jgi:hypothetical protein
MSDPFDPQTLSSDLSEVLRIYADFFTSLTPSDWERKKQTRSHEWNLHETIAHVYALNGVGLESIQSTLRGEPYIFHDLATRYEFNAYNRKGIDRHMGLPRDELCSRFMDIHREAALIARSLQSSQAEMAAVMPIYNRPVRIFEALSIIMIHAGIFHSAQVAEPAGALPLWKHLSPDIRHRGIGRVMRALSLLYRLDLGGDLEAAFVFQVDGPGGGIWHIDVSPEGSASDEGRSQLSGLTLRMRNTDIFCRMFTSRLNLPYALLSGQIKLSGRLQMFRQLRTLFSVDARKNDNRLLSKLKSR